MPNHITTQIRCNPAVAEALIHRRTQADIDRLKAENEAERESLKANAAERGITDPWLPEFRMPSEWWVDFNQVIPQPENIEKGGCSGQHEPGVVCWYEWNIANWGTKWGGYDAEISGSEGDQAVLRFDTAWAHPDPVIIALSKKFPEETLDVMYADEDLGFNLGAYTMKNGETTEVAAIEFGSDKAVDLASQIKYGKPYAEVKKEWGLDDDEDDEPAAIESSPTNNA